MTRHSLSSSVDRIESLFARMLVRYGTGWTRMWEGVDIAAVKAEWAEELSTASDASIFYALEYMPTDRPPTVKQFLALCQRAPAPALPALTPPKPTPEAKARVRSMISDLKRRMAVSRL